MKQGLGRDIEKRAGAEKKGGWKWRGKERVTPIDIPKGWTKERRTTGRVSGLLGA
jgi:hypothetical protein